MLIDCTALFYSDGVGYNSVVAGVAVLDVALPPAVNPTAEK